MLTEMLNLLTVLGARASLLALAVFLIRKYWKNYRQVWIFPESSAFSAADGAFLCSCGHSPGNGGGEFFPGAACGGAGRRRRACFPGNAAGRSVFLDGRTSLCRKMGRISSVRPVGGGGMRPDWESFVEISETEAPPEEESADPGEAFILGVWRPRVFISPDTPEDLRRHMEEHEKEHLRREDYFVKAAAYALCCIYWFHPLVWLAFRQLSQSMEIACDAGVIRGKSAEERKSYAASVVQAMTIPVQSVSGRMGFTDSFCRRRVEKILEPERMNGGTFRLPSVGRSVSGCRNSDACVSLSGGMEGTDGRLFGI